MSENFSELIPLCLKPSLHHTIWGGRNLADVAGKRLPADELVGESWETEIGNQITNGPFAGATLATACEAQGVSLLGTRVIEVYGSRFPLLAKFIDARDKLSVQVHPDDAQATRFAPGKLGKTEAWYVLHAEPEARLILGFERTVTDGEVREAIMGNHLEELLHSFVVRKGDVVFVPAGTVHAIGAGVVLYEIQEYSDITFRLYDYGRTQPDGAHRELHVQEGLDVLALRPAGGDCVRPLERDDTGPDLQRWVLVASPYFVLERAVFTASQPMTTQSTSCEILSVLDGRCELHPTAGGVVALERGETAVLPARLGEYDLRSDHVQLLRSYVPTADDAILSAWRRHQIGS